MLFRAFHRWTDKEAAATFQLEGENTFSRLGFIGTVGFVGLLGLLFWPAAATRFRGGAALSGASRLTLAALLLATIGGFGSLVALLVTPEIRAYNRITPFILFFSLTAVALAIDSLRSRRWRIAAAAAVLAVGLVDHKMATIRLNADHGYIARQVRAVRAFVEPLERGLPAGAMVLQLPFRTFLNDPGIARMEPYRSPETVRRLEVHSLELSRPVQRAGPLAVCGGPAEPARASIPACGRRFFGDRRRP